MSGLFSAPKPAYTPPPAETPGSGNDAELARQREQARNREIAAQKARRGGVVAGRTIALEKRQEEAEAKKASATLGAPA